MMSEQRRARRGTVWAVIGGVVALAAVAGIVLGSLFRDGAAAPASPSTSAVTPDPEPTGSVPRPADVVDASVAASGWVPEPVTTDPDVYARAALAAASTFDTQLSTRQEWLTYLDSWFTPDTRYATNQDRESDMVAAQLELRQGVVLPQEGWDTLAAQDGRVVADVPRDVMLTGVPDDPAGEMRIGTADVVLTFTQSDGSGGELSYDESVRVSVQVLCGEDSIPAPGSAQRPGDCKVVRFFSGRVEP
ncbi:hypothetical protein [Microbacterium sp. F2]|uniref:hypothetical protein n=1 Tax=Microbacterium sp. F2 TaxID=3422228 RepID=UPI003FD4B1C9